MSFDAFLKMIEDSGGGKLTRSLHTRPILKMIYDAHSFTKELTEPRVLNVFASRDKSGFREHVYQPLFENVNYETIDFWADKFIYQDEETNSSTLPFESNSFDALITTKILMEHVSEPSDTIKEIARVLKPRGEAFIIAPFGMPIHQPPHDYFRYTEHGLKHLFKKAKLEVIYIDPTLTGFMTVVDAFISSGFHRGFPKSIGGRLHAYSKRYLLPLAKRLDYRVPDRKLFCRHYICRVRKYESN
jgi:SAM-dependent methyltransferase